MSGRSRLAVFAVGGVGLAVVMGLALFQLPQVVEFSRFVSNYYLDVGVRETHSYNLVSSVIFDYRGADTMIEQLILFAAAVAVALLLRAQRTEHEEAPRDSIGDRAVPPTSRALRLAGVVLPGFALLIAVYVILHVQITPGGGFQSGVLVAGGLLAVHLADEYRTYDRLTPEATLERTESIAAGAYVLVGALGLAVAGSFLRNFLPLGELGSLVSSGTIWLLNLIVAFEVTAGFVLVFTEFLDQAVRIRERAAG